MKVAVLRNQLFLPSEVFIVEQARLMRRYQPLIIGRVIAGTPPEGVTYSAPSTQRSLDVFRYALFRNPRLMLKMLEAHAPALLHAHFGVEGVYGLPIARHLGLPLITTFHGFDATLRKVRLITSRKPAWFNYALGMRSLAKQGTLFICVSQFIRDKVVDLGFPADRTVLHYIGVDTGRFFPNHESEEKPIVLHVARLVEKKGTEYLLKAFGLIADMFPSVRLVIIGTGPLESHLMRMAADLGISSRVDWKGSLSHAVVKEWMAKSSVFCLPSCTATNGDSEGLSTVVVEASAAGVPILSTYHAGIPEAVIHGTTGYLVHERRTDQLAQALESLLSSYTLRRSMADAGRKLILEKFDLARQTQALEQIYDKALQ
jgi:glycosyltransferase involved in cell wall biosynthesis